LDGPCNCFYSTFRWENTHEQTRCGTGLSLFAAPLFAQAKPCDELKSEISAKLAAKGVKDPDSRLAIVATEEVKDQKVVGSCESGKKKITYEAAGASSAPKADAAAKPAGN
jgi:hypothetical protein